MGFIRKPFSVATGGLVKYRSNGETKAAARKKEAEAVERESKAEEQRRLAEQQAHAEAKAKRQRDELAMKIERYNAAPTPPRDESGAIVAGWYLDPLNPNNKCWQNGPSGFRRLAGR
jgi:uncharacterized protein YdaU (DUF1376 family)